MSIPDGAEHSWPEILSTLSSRRDLTPEASSWAMGQLMTGEATASQTAGFVMALQTKGISIDELRGIADEMLAHARTITVDGPSIDIVGTGGDRQNTVNISTMSCIVAAAGGATIVKHGNRSASSKSGAADVLEALGVVLSLGPERVVEVVGRTGITFCFAQDFHPSMRYVAGTRRDLGVATVFNLLGPLTNPARPEYASVGVAMEWAAPLVAGVFAGRGTDGAVFRGHDGLDEVTVTGPSDVWWIKDGAVQEFTVSPGDVGLEEHSLDDIRGGGPDENAQVVRDLLAGATSGRMQAVRDAVLLNAGIALTAVHGGDDVADRDSFVRAFRGGVERAESVLASGAAAQVLDRWRDETVRLSRG